MSQKSSDPQAISFVSQPLKRDTLAVFFPHRIDDIKIVIDLCRAKI